MALWTVHGDGRRLANDEVVRPDERLSWPLTLGVGLQHIAAMAGATVLVPTLTGFPVSTTLLFSGVGTLLFLLITRNRVPGYLGASFAFVAPLVAARGEGLAAQLGGVLFAGILVMVIGIAVKALGVRLIDSVMPPVVTGAVIALLGLNLAPAAGAQVSKQPWLAAVTLLVLGVGAMAGRGMLVRLSVLAAVLAGWLVGAVSGGIDPARLTELHDAAWFGLPALHQPQLGSSVMLGVLPAVVVLTAQNVGYVKAIGAATGRDLDCGIGDALIANGLVTALAGAGGGSALVPLGENVGVLAVTRVQSTAVYGAAATGAVLMSFCPKVTALVRTLPAGVLGALWLVLFGVVVLIGVRVWLDNQVNLADPLTMMVAGAAIVAGAGNVTIDIGTNLKLGGVVWGSLLIVLGHPLLRALRNLRTSARRRPHGRSSGPDPALGR